MTLHDDLEQSTKSLSEKSAENPKASNGAPPDNSNAVLPPLEGIPPAPFTPGSKPRLVEKLAKDPKELSEGTLQLMGE